MNQIITAKIPSGTKDAIPVCAAHMGQRGTDVLRQNAFPSQKDGMKKAVVLTSLLVLGGMSMVQAEEQKGMSGMSGMSDMEGKK